MAIYRTAGEVPSDLGPLWWRYPIGVTTVGQVLLVGSWVSWVMGTAVWMALSHGGWPSLVSYMGTWAIPFAIRFGPGLKGRLGWQRRH